MEITCVPALAGLPNQDITRRVAIGRLVISGAGAALLACDPGRSYAQEATSGMTDCVATAPPLEDGIGFVQLLVGGIVPDMPAGPVEVRISRLAMAPGTTIEAGVVPYRALMYIETGTTACPGGPGRIGYGPDGTVIEETTDVGIQYTSAGATQYIPANIPDGAGNEGPGLMSSIILEFAPVAQTATPTSYRDAPEAPIPSCCQTDLVRSKSGSLSASGSLS